MITVILRWPFASTVPQTIGTIDRLADSIVLMDISLDRAERNVTEKAVIIAASTILMMLERPLCLMKICADLNDYIVRTDNNLYLFT